MCFTTGLINVNVILEPTRVLLLALLLEKNAGCKHRVHTAFLSYFHALELKNKEQPTWWQTLVYLVLET